MNNIWSKNDFLYSDNVLLGFSIEGKKKIEENKNLTLLSSSDNDVKTIKANAFKGYDIENVDFSLLPNLEIIENEAFADNNLQEVFFTNQLNLKEIHENVFINNKGKKDLKNKVKVVTKNRDLKDTKNHIINPFPVNSYLKEYKKKKKA